MCYKALKNSTYFKVFGMQCLVRKNKQLITIKKKKKNNNRTLDERNRITQLIKIQNRKNDYAPNHSFHNIPGAGSTDALLYAIIAVRLQQQQQ